MTSEEKFKAIFRYFRNDEPLQNKNIAWIQEFLDSSLRNTKYIELRALIMKFAIRDGWCEGIICNSKILAVELIYSQFVKDGLIIDDSQAVQKAPKR